MQLPRPAGLSSTVLPHRPRGSTPAVANSVLFNIHLGKSDQLLLLGLGKACYGCRSGYPGRVISREQTDKIVTY